MPATSPFREQVRIMPVPRGTGLFARLAIRESEITAEWWVDGEQRTSRMTVEAGWAESVKDEIEARAMEGMEPDLDFAYLSVTAW